MILFVIGVIFYLGGGLPFVIELIGKMIGCIGRLINLVGDTAEKISNK